MGMEIALIPAAMFIVGIGMMIYMKKKRDSLAPGYAQQEMKRFVKEMVPQLSEEEFHVIDCPWNAEHHLVIAYTDESIFFIPALPNPMTMKSAYIFLLYSAPMYISIENHRLQK